MNIGTYTGTAAALNVSIGFRPTFLILNNETSAAPAITWGDGALDASLHFFTSAGTNLYANGITAWAGNDTAAPGITIGTSHRINVSGNIYRYLAFKSTEVDQ